MIPRQELEGWEWIVTRAAELAKQDYENRGNVALAASTFYLLCCIRDGIRDARKMWHPKEL